MSRERVLKTSMGLIADLKTLVMSKEEKQSMIEDAMVVMSGDMFQKIYDLKDFGWVWVTNEIKSWAKEFVEQLDWQGCDDERDWLLALEAFEDKKFVELKNIYC